MKIRLLNKIAPVGLEQLGGRYEVGTDMENPDGILVRSAVMHDMIMGENLAAIARAGAGVNNIPVDRCAEAGIVVFNTPGANANGVRELAICALLLAARDVIGGVEWVKGLTGPDIAKQVEKGKSAFAGSELTGKTLGVIGLGAIGGMLANSALALGMKVVGCDPFLSVDGAWNLDHRVTRAATFDEIFAASDYITLHVPATKDTKGMISAASIAKMRDGVRIVNLARADLVCAEDLKAALESGKVAKYVTDFPTDDMTDAKNAVLIPHLGASTEESENNCAVMAARELDDYLTDGNIRNSVNYPTVEQPRTGDARICVLHANIPAVLSGITTALAADGVNIENMTNKSKGDNAYTVLDVSPKPAENVTAHIRAIGGVRRVRVLL
ncbi:MAG TPA: 3-phosphoglycerate dehydrogenase [Clostridiales bacterium]|nr:3-phosphoglycerate dehydrogenase [Clostridiales bacterium]